MALIDQVKQAAGSCDEDIDSSAHGVDLWALADAAPDRGEAEADFFSIGGKAFCDLAGEFAGGGEDEDTALFRADRAGIVVEGIEDGQCERCGFTGSGLSATEEVATFQEQRDRLGLDGGRGGVVEFVKNLFQGRGKSHRFKCSGHVLFLKTSKCRCLRAGRDR